jgi:hypothetical protein
MDYTEEDLLELIKRHDEHEDYYLKKLTELRLRHILEPWDDEPLSAYVERVTDEVGQLVISIRQEERGKAAKIAEDWDWGRKGYVDLADMGARIRAGLSWRKGY